LQGDLALSKRTLKAFFFAPLLPALIPAGLTYFNGVYEPVSMFLFFCFVSYVLQAVGVPAYWLLARNKMHRLWIYVLLGFSTLALLFVFLMLRRHTAEGYTPADYWMAITPGIYGALVGLMFWLLARPDKSADTEPNSN
jgi:hypothetical protein